MTDSLDSGSGLDSSGWWAPPSAEGAEVSGDLDPAEATLNIWRYLKYRVGKGEIGGVEDGSV